MGGGAASVGRALGKKLYQPGLNASPAPEAMQINSVLSHFARQGTPVIHLVEITQLARLHGLPVAPAHTPVVGSGPLFASVSYNRWLVAIVLVGVLASLKILVASTGGVRAIAWWRGRRRTDSSLRLVGQAASTELMV